MDIESETELWAQRRAALAAGQPWDEATVVITAGGTVLSEGDGAAAIAAGTAVHCKQCSSPRQRIYHVTEREAGTC